VLGMAGRADGIAHHVERAGRGQLVVRHRKDRDLRPHLLGRAGPEPRRRRDRVDDQHGRIGQGAFDEDATLGLGALLFSALLYAYNFIVIRKQSQLAGPLEVATFHSGVGGLVLLVFAPIFWITPDPAALGAISAGSALTVIASMALAWAYARAETQALVPIEYSGFLWASLFGWLFFNEAVSLPTIAGTILIVSGCWLATTRPRLRAPKPA